jgi:extradiol dioxygenase family protein
MSEIATVQRRSIFHHSVPVTDIGEARYFYGEVLGCPEILPGKRGTTRSDYDFFGHHLALKEVSGDDAQLQREAASQFFVRHFGVFLSWDEWESLVERLERYHVDLPYPPAIADEGTPEESGSVQLADPAGNGIEFKTARDSSAWFAQ